MVTFSSDQRVKWLRTAHQRHSEENRHRRNGNGKGFLLSAYQESRVHGELATEVRGRAANEFGTF